LFRLTLGRRSAVLLSYNPELPNPNFAKTIVLGANEKARDALKLRLRERVEQGLAPEARVRAPQFVFRLYSPCPVAFRVMGPDLERDRAIAAKVQAGCMLANPYLDSHPHTTRHNFGHPSAVFWPGVRDVSLPLCSPCIALSIPACNSQTPKFTEHEKATASGPVKLIRSDFNNDSVPDIAIANQEAGTVSVFLMDAAGTIRSRQDFAVGQNPNAIVAVDFNHDHKMDLLTTNADPNELHSGGI
jgi:hypothetical protein